MEDIEMLIQEQGLLHILDLIVQQKIFLLNKKKKKGNKARKLDIIYGKKSLYEIKNVSVAQFTEKSNTFGKHKYSNGTQRNKEFLSIYGNGEMANTQYTSRNDESSINNSFANSKKTSQLYKCISNSKSTVGAAFHTQLSTQNLNESHEYNYDISTPISNSILKTSPFKTDLIANIGNHHMSKDTIHNNIIVEDEKEVNYSSSNYSSHRKKDLSKEKIKNNLHAESEQILHDRQKERSFNKDLITKMKEKIKKKKRNGIDISKILVLGASNAGESYKDMEYTDFGINNRHNISSFNNTKQSKKVSSLGRSPHKKKHKIVKKVDLLC